MTSFPSTRRTLYFTAPCQVAVRERPLPAPADDQVLVETLVSAISPGTEMLFYRGQVPPDLSIDATISALAGQVVYPLQYGYACVGRVVVVGPAVAAEWQDRLVFAFHPHESHFLAQVDELLPVPPGLSPEQAALLPNMESAVNFVMDGQPVIGEKVLVCGQGIVGLLTTYLLAQFPLQSLISVDLLALRRQLGQQLGATQTLTPAELLACLPLDADLVYELSGNPAALDQAIAACGFDGRVIIGSWYGQKRADLHLGGRFHRSRIRLISSQVSTLAPCWQGRWDKARRLATAWHLLARLEVGPLITQQFSINEAEKAYRLIDQQPAEVVQVLLRYDE